MLAHELRNPLAPIRNALEIMRRTGKGGEDFRKAGIMMERQVDQLVRLVDDLLDINRISRGSIEMRKERVELVSILEHAAESIRPLCDGNGLDLVVRLPRGPIGLDADPTRVAQAVGNLLHNACKFTPRGGRIELECRTPGPQVVEVRVRDTGIGIAAGDLPGIFELFSQVDGSLSRSHGGLGIGLTLVRSLVELHGGTVEASSPGIGQGSTFVVRLPVEGEAAVAGISPSGPGAV
jgi:signal transduction histidine kinase